MPNVVQVIEKVISVISVTVVIYGALLAFIEILKNELSRFTGKFNKHKLRVIRADLGTYLLLGLELLIAADVLKTILDPELHEVAILGAIVVLRILLSFFLDREIKELEKEKVENPKGFTEEKGEK